MSVTKHTFCTNISCKKLGGAKCKQFKADRVDKPSGSVFCVCGCKMQTHCEDDHSRKTDGAIDDSSDIDDDEGGYFPNIPHGLNYAKKASASKASASKASASKHKSEFNMFDDSNMGSKKSASGTSSKSTQKKRAPGVNDESVSKKKRGEVKMVIEIDSDDAEVERPMKEIDRQLFTDSSSSASSTPSSHSSLWVSKPPPMRLPAGRLEELNSTTSSPVVIIFSAGTVRESHWEFARSPVHARADAYREGGPDSCVGTDADAPAAEFLTDSEGEVVPFRQTLTVQPVIHQARYCFGCMTQHLSGDKFMCLVCSRWVFCKCSDDPDYNGPKAVFNLGAKLCCVCSVVNTREVQLMKNKMLF